MTFEEALTAVSWGRRVRRACWANKSAFTRTTPPIQCNQVWRIWLPSDWCGRDNWSTGIVQGWGGQIGAMLDDDDPIRDGTGYQPTNEDRTAIDWELLSL